MCRSSLYIYIYLVYVDLAFLGLYYVQLAYVDLDCIDLFFVDLTYAYPVCVGLVHVDLVCNMLIDMCMMLYHLPKSSEKSLWHAWISNLINLRNFMMLEDSKMYN